MSTHKHIEKICCVVIALALVLTGVFMQGETLGIQAASKAKGYESRLFDTGVVHTIDIVMEDWDGFLAACTNEEYVLCSVVIDNEAYKNVAIRAKGNTSLTQVKQYGNNRYSFKIEFDHYDGTNSYHGLDKLSLNNIIQDNTYMKDYLTYQMMGYFGVDAPLCSYAYITVNGEDWGLYLAVESVEESFLERRYGRDYGALYKPDSQSMGGGRGQGGRFEMNSQWIGENAESAQGDTTGGRGDKTRPAREPTQDGTFQLPDGAPQMPDGIPQPPGEMTQPPDDAAQTPGGGKGGMNGVMGSGDVSLVYTDDEYSSYSNILDNAKTEITDADKDRLIASLKQLNEGENLEEVVDIDEVLRYFVVHNFVCNFDSYTGSMIHNYYLYEKDGQFSMIPWDYNLAFGGFQGAQDASALVNYPIDTPVSGGTVESRPMLAWIFSNEAYTAQYHQYFASFISGYFNSGYFSKTIDGVWALISPYVEKDPTKFCTYEDFEAGVSALKSFCLLRAQSVEGQLDGSIPSTSDGQAQSRDTFVDASAVRISDMGTMQAGKGGGQNGFQTNGGEETGDQSGTENRPEGGRPGMQLPEGNGGTPAPPGDRPDENPGDGQGTGSAPGARNAQAWIEIGVSAMVLLAGVLAVFWYKKRA